MDKPVHVKKRIQIIEAPSNLGLIEPSPGTEPGVKRMPEWLRMHGLYDHLHPENIVHLDPPEYGMKYDEETGVRNPDKVISFSELLSNEVSKSLQAFDFTFVAGGDCSILIGCALGLRKSGRYGLVYLDGHTDFILPPSSMTKGTAGMDLAIVTGYGHNRLTNIEGLKPYVMEQDVIAIGNREYDQDYVAQISKSDIEYVDLQQLRKKGIESVVNGFLLKMESRKTDGFWIHFDVDVLDDEIMPCVDSRQPDGLNYEELLLLMKMLLHSPMACGLNITILDPDLDPEGKYTREFVKKWEEIHFPV